MQVFGLNLGVFIGNGEKPMLMISTIAAALAKPTTDNSSNATVIIGVVIAVFFLLLIGASSSGTSAKKVLKKSFCPHCKREINVTAHPTRTMQKTALTSRGKGKNVRFANSASATLPRVNAPIQRVGGKMYCPYCHKRLLAS